MTDRTEAKENRAVEPPASSRSPESYERLASPSLRTAWLLRTGALVGVVSTVLGAIVLPGLHGVASDAAITQWERVSGVFAYAMGLLLAGLLLTGAFDLSRSRGVGIVPRALLFFGAPGVLAMLVPAFAKSLSPIGSLVLVVATVIVALGGGVVGLRAPHTRVLGLVQLVFAFAGVMRFVGWLVAALAPDSLRAYTVAHTFDGAGVVGEGAAQMLIVAWLSTRRRLETSVAAMVALACAFVLVWIAGRADASSPAWQSVMRSGLASQGAASSTLGAIEAFFVAASVLLALVCALTPHQITVVTCALALALLGRGAFDVPLRALAATAAALWTTLAAVDERAMWRALVGGRSVEKRTEPAKEPEK